MNRPKAPADLWERLDAIRGEELVAEKPPGSFDSADYASRYHLSPGRARAQLRKLRSSGKVREVGRRGMCIFYRPT